MEEEMKKKVVEYGERVIDFLESNVPPKFILMILGGIFCRFACEQFRHKPEVRKQLGIDLAKSLEKGIPDE